LTLPIFALKHLLEAVVGPVAIVSQDSIDAFGHRLPKDRPIHDQSFSFGSGQLLNNRVTEDELTPCLYDFALLRYIHKIAALRGIYPSARILLSKFDIKLAYRRVHFRAESDLQSCITTKGLGGINLALVSLRTTFGGSPCPSILSSNTRTEPRVRASKIVQVVHGLAHLVTVQLESQAAFPSIKVSGT
jgi:hypothetical protein